MRSLAPRAAAPGFGATAFLDRHRGAAAAAMAPASSVRKTREPTRRARASDEVPTTAPARKRGRHDVVDPDAASSSALRTRMDAELVALQGLLKRAKHLPRSAAPLAEKKHAPAPVSSSSAAKRTAPPSKPAATEAACAPAKQKQQQPVQHAAAAAKTEVLKKRRLEEEKELVARAAAREEFRRMLVEMEKAALPDERIYPEEMEALGIPFEFLVTRTWKKACLDYHAAKKLEFVA